MTEYSTTAGEGETCVDCGATIIDGRGIQQRSLFVNQDGEARCGECHSDQ